MMEYIAMKRTSFLTFLFVLITVMTFSAEVLSQSWLKIGTEEYKDVEFIDYNSSINKLAVVAYSGSYPDTKAHVLVADADSLNWKSSDLNFNVTSDNSLNDIIVADGGEIYVASDQGVFRSTDFGKNWELLTNGLVDKRVSVIDYSNNTGLLAGTFNGIFRYSFQASTFERYSDSLPWRWCRSISIAGGNIAASFALIGVYVKTSQDDSWKSILPSGDIIDPIFLQGDTLVSGSSNHLIVTDVATSVSDSLELNIWAVYTNSFAPAGKYMYCSITSIEKTADIKRFEPGTMDISDINTKQFTDRNIYVYDIAYTKSNYLFAVASDGLYRTTEPLVTAIPSTREPVDFTLHSPYPNPIDADATLEYSIPSRQQISMALYDGLGRKVQTLVDAQIEPGGHSVILNADQLSSGIYHCVMIGEAGVVTRTIVVRK